MKNTQRAALFVFLRFPRPGKVKTRLAQSLGEKRAALFYRLCADSLFNEIGKMPWNVVRYIFYADKTDAPEVRRWAGPGFNFVVQEGNDLGQRLKNAFSNVFDNGIQKAVVIASDVPDLSATIMNESVQALDNSDIVIGPCYDGGYYLLGMKKLHDELFKSISWSTEEVYPQTLAAIKKNGLTVHQLQTLIDIDTEADIHKWLQMNKQRPAAFDAFFEASELKPRAESKSK